MRIAPLRRRHEVSATGTLRTSPLEQFESVCAALFVLGAYASIYMGGLDLTEVQRHAVARDLAALVRGLGQGLRVRVAAYRYELRNCR